jgi:uncharacterized protein
MNPVQHFDLPSKEPARAKKFYEQVFGWEVNPMPGGGIPYWALVNSPEVELMQPKIAGTINGGMYMRTGEKDSLTIYVTVDSIEKTLKKAAEQGGKTVMPKMPVGEMGFAAKISDSEGNIIGLWETAMKK